MEEHVEPLAKMQIYLTKEKRKKVKVKLAQKGISFSRLVNLFLDSFLAQEETTS